MKILLIIDLYTLSPKNLNSEACINKNYLKKIKKINLNHNWFNQKCRKEKPKINNKNRLVSLETENYYIYKRINNVTSTYQNKNFQRDFERSKIYKTNICKLPKINFNNYKRDAKFRETPKKIYKINYDNFNTINTNLTLTTKNNINDNRFDLDDIDYISLYFFLGQNLNDHPYIIISNPDELFTDVLKKFCDTVPFIKREDIAAFKYENNQKFEVQMFKSVKENKLTDKSKIIIEKD